MLSSVIAKLRVAFRSVLFLVPAFAIAEVPLMVTPSPAFGQEEEKVLEIDKAKAPSRFDKSFIFSTVYIGLLVTLAAVLMTALLLACRSKKISGATVCFIVGAALLTCPLWGILGFVPVSVSAFVDLARNEGPPNPNAVANATSASLLLLVFFYVCFLMVPFGIVAIIAAFFFRKPITNSPPD